MGSLKNDITSTHEEEDSNSLSSKLSDIDDASQKSNHLHLTESPSSSFSSSSDDSSSSSSTSDSFMTSDYSSIETDELSALNKIDKKQDMTSKKYSDKKISGNNSRLTSDKVCCWALQMIKFLGTLHMRKLDLKHDPRLRRITFLEWISQLEIAFSSNKYTTKVLQDY